jgi:hypothetical protein
LYFVQRRYTWCCIQPTAKLPEHALCGLGEQTYLDATLGLKQDQMGQNYLAHKSH